MLIEDGVAAPEVTEDRYSAYGGRGVEGAASVDGEAVLVGHLWPWFERLGSEIVVDAAVDECGGTGAVAAG